jgi:hypothetical protein
LRFEEEQVAMRERAGVFSRLPPKPDHPALELEVLDRWERDRIFQRLRENNLDGPKWSFVDGPVTANKVLAVHTAWGRTLKDVFQRYRAMRGFDQRYQNGFDCQGLWIEVGVERELGLNSKRDIESYGLAEFARKCREKVIWSATELTSGSKRLGQWMDWGNDYYTFSDTNIEYIWRFLRVMHERGWLYQGYRSTEWCPRCGTSMSQHELSQADVYREKTDPSIYVRLPLRERPGEELVIWTTTPWTLPANVAAAVKPDAEYILREDGTWVARARYPHDHAVKTALGSEVVGLTYDGPFDHLPAAARDHHRVISWDEVSLDEGTGIVHIAPGRRDRGLRAVEDPRPPRTGARGRGRPLLRRLWLAARPRDRGVGRPDRGGPGRARPAGVGRRDRSPLSALLALPDAVDLSRRGGLVYRGRRASAAAARGERHREMDARVHGQAHGRLAPQDGRLEHLQAPVLRPAPPVLPVLLRTPERDRGQARTGGAGHEGAGPARGAAPAVDRRGSHPV